MFFLLKFCDTNLQTIKLCKFAMFLIKFCNTNLHIKLLQICMQTTKVAVNRPEYIKMHTLLVNCIHS